MEHFNIHLNLKVVVVCKNRKQLELELSLWNASQCEIWFQQFSMLLLVAGYEFGKILNTNPSCWTDCDICFASPTFWLNSGHNYD